MVIRFVVIEVFLKNIVSDQRNCKNLPGFKDKWGTTCERTMEDGNCKNGKPWGIPAEELGQKDANSDGVSVLDACCGCGGGTYEGNAFETLRRIIEEINTPNRCQLLITNISLYLEVTHS